LEVFLEERAVERMCRDIPMRSKLYNQNISENDLIYLQDLFLTNGIHNLSSPSTNQARKVLYKILKSLNYYQDIASLSLSDQALSNNVYDIYTNLLINNFLSINSSNNLNISNSENLINFFQDKFYFDFLWIELTEELEETDWYSKFENFIINFKFDKIMPICIVQI